MKVLYIIIIVFLNESIVIVKEAVGIGGFLIEWPALIHTAAGSQVPIAITQQLQEEALAIPSQQGKFLGLKQHEVWLCSNLELPLPIIN
jgi:hypothetical protein